MGERVGGNLVSAADGLIEQSALGGVVQLAGDHEEGGADLDGVEKIQRVP